LALHFAAFDSSDRAKIWRKAIHSLHETNVVAKVDELLERTTALAKDELNGRQIGNIVKLAIQLASHRGEILDFSHFETVMEASQEFARYISASYKGQLF
jgi:hypothetical protein